MRQLGRRCDEVALAGRPRLEDLHDAPVRRDEHLVDRLLEAERPEADPTRRRQHIGEPLVVHEQRRERRRREGLRGHAPHAQRLTAREAEHELRTLRRGLVSGQGVAHSGSSMPAKATDGGSHTFVGCQRSFDTVNPRPNRRKKG